MQQQQSTGVLPTECRWRKIVRQSPIGLTLTFDLVGGTYVGCALVERQLSQLHGSSIPLRSLRVQPDRGNLIGGKDVASAKSFPSMDVTMPMELLLGENLGFHQRSGPHLQSVVLKHDGSWPFQFSPIGEFPALMTLCGFSNGSLYTLPPELESLHWTWIRDHALPGDWGEQPCLPLRRLPNLRRVTARWIKGISGPEPLLQQLPLGLRYAHFVFEDTVPWRMDVLGRWVSMAQRLPGMQAVMSSDKAPGCTSKTYISIELHRADVQQGE